MSGNLFAYPVRRRILKSAFALSILVLLVISASAAPTEPVPNLPTSTPEAALVASETTASIPPIPDEIPPEVELQRARQALTYALEKRLETRGKSYQVELIDVRMEGSWAYALANFEGRPVYLLAHRYGNDLWQAITPGDQGIYTDWLEQLPDTLLTQEMKESALSQFKNWVHVLPEEPRTVFEESLLPIPTPALFDGVVPLQPEYNDDILISNSLFLYSSTVLDFDIQLFLESQVGPLSHYSEEIDGEVWTAAEIIEYNAFLFGVNPQVILTMLEVYSGIITDANAQIPMDTEIEEQNGNTGFHYFVFKMTNDLLSAYHSRIYNQAEDMLNFPAGETTIISDEINAGTYAIQFMLAQFLPFDQWQQWVTGNSPQFLQKYRIWFGDSSLAVDTVRDPSTSTITSLPSGYMLPFPVGETWYYTGGPHHNNGMNHCLPGTPRSNCPAGPWSSVDIAPPEQISCPSGATPTNRWVVASRSGNVVYSAQAIVIIDHGDGWSTQYLHLADANRRGLGPINQGDPVGNPSCRCLLGGSNCSTGVHVHFSVRTQAGEYVDISGSSLSNWLIQETTHYNGTMNRAGVQRTATVGRYNGTNDILNNGTGQVNLYSAPNQGGSVLYSLGTGLRTNLSPPIYSMSMPSGWSAITYDQSDGTGGSRCWNTNVNNFQDYSDWQNRLRSIRVYNYDVCPSPPSGQVRLYSAVNQGGTVLHSLGTGLHTNLNPPIYSMSMPSGWSAITYDQSNGTGGSRCWYANVNNFQDYSDWQNRLRSIRVNNSNVCPPDRPTLSSPNNGTFINEGSNITLSWNTAALASQYYAEYFGGPAGTLNSGWQSGTSWNIGSQWAGHTYSWRVKARNANGESSWSSTWTFTVRPATPTGLSGNAASPTSISLSWQDNSSNEEGYKIYRNGAHVGTVGANNSSYSYQDTGLTCATNYSYYVKAYRGSIESNPSSTIQVSTQACAPTLPTANFDAWPQSGNVPLTVAFHNTSSGNYTSCLWNYGDGNTGTSCASYHDYTYTTPGNYTVSLTVTGPGGSDSRTITDYITANPACPAVTVPGLINPVDGAYVGTDSPILSWQAASNATQYEIELSFSPTFIIKLYETVIGTEHTFSSLSQGLWYWRVRSFNFAPGCDPDMSEWSQVRTFTVDTIAPAVNWVSPVVNQGVYTVGDQTVLLEIEATDNRSMSYTYFERWDAINEHWIGLGYDYSEPYQYELDTSSINYDWNHIYAWAVDSAGNYRSEYILLYRYDCTDVNEPNNEPGAATNIAYGQSINGTICGMGDVDYFAFSGESGDKVVIDIDAQILGSSLDSFISLIGSDGTTVLAINDDAEGSSDSKLGYILQSDGTYYIEVRAYDHGIVGDPGQFYTLNLYTDYASPSAEIVSPTSGSWLDPDLETILGVAADAESGIRSATFWYHDATITDPYWFWMGEGVLGGDGWTIHLTTNLLLEQQGIEISFQVYDWVNNFASDTSYGLGLDRTPPTSAVQELAPVQYDTTFLVSWSGSDALSGIAVNGYDIQYRDGVGGAWTDWLIGTNLTSANFTGQNGHTYYFRSRARDNASNQEAYVDGDGDTFTTIDVSYCFTLTRSYTGSGSSPTASPPNSTDCPLGEYNAGEHITLMPHPATGHHLGYWTGTNSSSSNSLTMPAHNHSVSAHYAHTGPVPVAILDRASTSGISYWTGANNNDWDSFRLVLENDPENRFAVTITTELSPATLSNFAVLLLPDNAVPDDYLTSVNNWFTAGKRIIAVDSATTYAAFSGFMWPSSVGSNGFGTYWNYSSGSGDQLVLVQDKITENYALGNVLPAYPGDAQLFRSQLPADALALTAKQSNHDHVYVAYRQVPDKGTIVVLGPFNPLAPELDELVRDAVEGPAPNNPPHTPTNPAPANGAVNQPTSLTLSWAGGDPDSGDAVIYDVYLEANNPVPTNPICEGVAVTSCAPIGLVNGVTYYWYVLATDNHGATAAGPVWSFTTSDSSVCTLTWQAGITATDNGNVSSVLTVGQGPTATDGLDVTCSEALLPPPPPVGSFDARLTLPGGALESLKDFRSDLLTEADWQIKFQAGIGGYPFTFTWDPTSLPAGSVRLKDMFGGFIVDVDMKAQNSFVLSSAGITQLKIEFRSEMCLNLDMSIGWNMVSVPVQAADMQLDVLFPEASTPAYYYTNAYQPVQASDVLLSRRGYWMYFASPQNYQVCGHAVDPQDISVNVGWNLIGPLEQSSPVSGINSTPTGILNLPIYGYANGYIQAEALSPGKAYWAYANQSGILHLGDNSGGANWLASPPTEGGNGQPHDFSLPLTISAGNDSIAVSLGVSPQGSAGYDPDLDLLAPPPPPTGAFDARLVGNGMDYLVDVRGRDQTLYSFTLRYKTNESGEPIILTWDQDTVSHLGTFEIVDLFGGELVLVDMGVQNKLVVDTESVLSEGLLIRFIPFPLSHLHRIYVPIIVR